MTQPIGIVGINKEQWWHRVERLRDAMWDLGDVVGDYVLSDDYNDSIAHELDRLISRAGDLPEWEDMYAEQISDLLQIPLYEGWSPDLPDN